MRSILPHETEITGTWIMVPGSQTEDANCHRIAEILKSDLTELGRDESGWDALYRDRNDQRLWELIFPQSDLQGGGPPKLRCLSIEQAKSKYDCISTDLTV